MRNAIPREACAVLVFNPEDTEGLEDYIKEYEAQIMRNMLQLKVALL